MREEGLQLFKTRRMAVLTLLRSEAIQGGSQEAIRPTLFIYARGIFSDSNAHSSQFVFRLLCIQRQRSLTSSAFLRPHLTPAVVEKVAYAHPKKRAKTSLIPIHPLQPIAAQHVRKKFLRRILRLVPVDPTRAGKNINRHPVGTAKAIKRLNPTVGRGQHHAP